MSKSHQNQQPEKKKSMIETLDSIETVLKERYEKTRRETWRVAWLCIKQGKEQIKNAKNEDEQVAGRLRAMGEEISDLQSREL